MPDLPARPSLEQYRKQAKDLVKDHARAAPEALARIRRHHPRLRDLPDPGIRSATFKLADAQLVLAREHAFQSWTKFAAHVRSFDPAAIHLAERIPVEGVELEAEIAVPPGAAKLVLFTNASGSSRYHPANRHAAGVFNHAGLGAVLTDLLTEDEELADSEIVLDLRLLSRRILAIADWLGRQPSLRGLRLACFAMGAGAAAALLAASERPSQIRSLVSIGGRPDLAGACLWKVQAPSLFIVDGKDAVTLGFHSFAMELLPPQTARKLEIASKDAFEHNAILARDWFAKF